MDTTTKPIRDVETLLAELEAAGSREAIGRTLARIEFGLEALQPFLHFDPTFYTRNLLRRTPDFELIALCWEPGQATPIHDHDDSDGWVVGMSGSVEEVRYRPKDSREEGVEFERLGSTEVTPGAVAHIHDDIAVHEIRNDGAERAVSLHLYAPPIDECRGYDSKSGRWVTRRMRYHTIEGAPASS